MTHGGDYQPDTDGVASDQLRSYVERTEALNAQLADINEEKKELFAEAKGNGFNPVAIKEIVKIRADPDKHDEKQTIVDLYKRALNMR